MVYCPGIDVARLFVRLYASGSREISPVDVDVPIGPEDQRHLVEARDVLLPAASNYEFRMVSLIPYNLACYEAQLGDLKAARRWLQRPSRSPA
jgi:hypothetical protein